MFSWDKGNLISEVLKRILLDFIDIKYNIYICVHIVHIHMIIFPHVHARILKYVLFVFVKHKVLALLF